MSLEKKIADLTEAVVALTEAMVNGADSKPAKKAEPKAESKPAKKAEPKAEEPAEESAPSLDDVKAVTLKAVSEFNKSGAVKDILKEFGVAKATLLEEKDRASYISKVEAVIADGDDDLV